MLLAKNLTIFDGVPFSSDAARKFAGRSHGAHLAEVAPIDTSQASHA